MAINYKPYYLLLLILALVVNVIGINNGFFADDPGLYASLAKNMVYRRDVLQLFTYGQDWLDKPHFPFWAAYVSFKLFGISVWAYRLPALLFFLLSCVYVYLFTRRFYTKEIALTAVLIVMTTQHIILSNVDVRAEPYLMAFIIGSIYHIARLHARFSVKHMVLAALLTACAIMTKGIFVIAAIYGSLLGQLIFEGQFLQLFKAKWWLLYLLTFIFTLPEFYALYIQFDMHPEKLVFDRHNVSGIRWFLWDSQFGRFANTGPIKHAPGSVFFFLHTMLWAFAPWCLLFYLAVFYKLKSIWQKVKLPEYYTLSGGLLLLALFSLSKFQLPFYPNILYPLFAIVTAPLCYAALSARGHVLRQISLLAYAILLPLAIIALYILSKPAGSLLLVVDTVLFGSMVILLYIKVKQARLRLFMFTCCAVLFANFYLSTVFFKTVAHYNGEISAAEYINQNTTANTPVYTIRLSNNVFQFYCNRPVAFVPAEGFASTHTPTGALFFVNQASMDMLVQKHAAFTVVKAFENYPHENILPAFINSATRYKVLDKAYLISK
ncbi:hypothetical protein FFF34_017735 [Inquilinus sp. KBS0705]|nr:hypothetical protein FFF34_017735 [Inquilinus sp. KBS0705]